VDFSLPTDLRLENTSTYQQLVAAMRRLVLDGSLPPGSRLREVPLAQSFGVSRNTVREAVRGLKQEGLVSHDRHHSAVVATLGESDAADLYRVRRLLEIGAADELERLTATQAAAIEHAFARLSKVARLGEWAEVIESDLAFHRSLIGVHGSPRLLRAFDAIWSESAFCMALLRLHEHEDEQPGQVIEEHRAIRDAVLAHDAPRTRELLVSHLGYYEGRARAIMRQLGAGDPANALTPAAPPS